VTTDKLSPSICSSSVDEEGCAFSMYSTTQRDIVPIRHKPRCTFGKIKEKAFPGILVFCFFYAPFDSVSFIFLARFIGHFGSACNSPDL
jgi:hypothetical protein